MRLIAENLSGERGGQPIFSGAAFVLDPGETLLVTGPNGSGKSTLLRIICGLLPAAGGSIRLERANEDFPTLASVCHYLGHDNAMKAALTVSENLGFWRAFYGAPDLTVVEALESVGLETIGHLPFGYLSAGQRRRTAIAKLLVSRREIWLLDEPTAGLDQASDMQFAGLMRGHCEGGGIVVAATHLPLGLGGVKELKMGTLPSPLWKGRPKGGVGAVTNAPMTKNGTFLRHLHPARFARPPPHKGEGKLLALFLRDIQIGVRAGGGALTGVLFFLAIIVVVPFGVGPDLNLLARIGPAILWTGALLASLLGLDRLFQADREDGSLDLLILTADRHMLALTVLAKCLAHWTSSVLPLVIAAPLLGLFMNMEPVGMGATALTLLVGTPAITFIGAVGAAVAVVLPRGGLLISVLVLPLVIPVLIFGVSASYAAVNDPDPFLPPFLILCALTLIMAVIGPAAAALALRSGQD